MDYEDGMTIMPFHPAETKSHLRSFNNIGLKVAFIGGAVNLAISFLVANFFDIEPFLDVARAVSEGAFLRLKGALGENNLSAAAYISSALTSLPIIIASFYLIFSNYKSEVLSRHAQRVFRWSQAVGVIISIALVFLVIYFQFFFEIDFGARFRSALSSIFLFPLFCPFSALWNFVVAGMIMNVPIFVMKLEMKDSNG